MTTTTAALDALSEASGARTLPADWQGRTATAKLASLWNEFILPTEFSHLPAHESRFPRLSKTYLAQSFDHVGDEMPAGHKRVLHLRGSVAMAEWRAAPGIPYTGLYRGASSVLLRISSGGSPSSSNFVPGMGVKLLVDGTPSANIQVMNSVDGQGNNHDVFALPFTNHIPPARSWLVKLGALLFRRVKDDPYDLPVRHLALREADGTVQEAPLSPDKLLFIPGPDVPRRTDPQSSVDFREDLARIPANTTLYNIFSVDGSGALSPLGQLVTHSRFVASEWADERLFFQHPRS